MISGLSILRRLPILLSRMSIMLLLCALAADRGNADGGVLLGTTTLLNSGDTALKLDLVFLGDGFTEAEQDDFNRLVDEAVIGFLSAHPVHALQNAFNVHRVNVSSPESGTDIYAECDGEPVPGATDVRKRTAMDSGYCGGGSGTVNRCMFSSDLSLAEDFAANAPDDDIKIVLVNDTGHGGCASFSRKLTFLTVENGFEDVVIHELGHAMFDLADEYNYGGPDTFSGTASRVNVSTDTDRATLKWRDLVLPDTPLPTQIKEDCTDASLPAPIVPLDIVGTFEGAQYSRCGIYRPQYTGRMRQSGQDFHAVSRRQIIRTLIPHLDRHSAVILHDLHVKNDRDGAFRGAGDIYLNYAVSGIPGGQGRWPRSGDEAIDTGDTETLNTHAGTIIAESPATLDLRVRDNDWPDGDDTLRNDVNMQLPSGGRFTIDERDYEMTARVIGPVYKLLFDTLNVKNDKDPLGKGDIYVNYTVSNGMTTISGRWPRSGNSGFDDGETKPMNIEAAAFSKPTTDNQLTVRVRIMDDDLFFDDQLGNDAFVFTEADDFGAERVIQIEDGNGNYRVTFSIVGAPPPPQGPIPDVD